MTFEEPKQLEEIYTDPGETNEIDLIAIIIRKDFKKPGLTFFTDPRADQQVAYIEHPKGKLIPPHMHPAIPRKVSQTREVLLIRKGYLRVDFYDFAGHHFTSRVLGSGDLVLLIQGGHGFEVLEDVELYEVKQGPYQGEHDKVIINPR